MSENQDPNVETYTVERMLQVPMPESKRADKALELSVIILKQRRLDREYSDVKSDFNSRLKDLGAQAEGIAKEIEEGGLELVGVDVSKDHTHNLIVETRKDTGEKITNRPMTAEDHQSEIPTGDNGTGETPDDGAGGHQPEA